jgi:hypothetical protein
MKSVKRQCRVLAASILVTFFLVATTSSLAAAGGYWSCSDGAWTAVGRPAYPSPVKACGSQFHVPGTEAECQEAGGRWGAVGIFPQPICRVPTHDAGRICGDNGECEGMCLADLTQVERDKLRREKVILSKLGRCTPYVQVFGCMAIVKKGHVTGLVCRD